MGSFFIQSLWYQADKRWWFGCAIRLSSKSFHLFITDLKIKLPWHLKQLWDITNTFLNSSPFPFFFFYLWKKVSKCFYLLHRGTFSNPPNAYRWWIKVKTGDSALRRCALFNYSLIHLCLIVWVCLTIYSKVSSIKYQDDHTPIHWAWMFTEHGGLILMGITRVLQKCPSLNTKIQ